jgi:hypothetical protein
MIENDVKLIVEAMFAHWIAHWGINLSFANGWASRIELKQCNQYSQAHPHGWTCMGILL